MRGIGNFNKRSALISDEGPVRCVSTCMYMSHFKYGLSLWMCDVWKALTEVNKYRIPYICLLLIELTCTLFKIILLLSS